MKLSRVTAAAVIAAFSVAIPASAGNGGAAYAPGTEAEAEYRVVKATWYGPGLYGNRTACGQRLTRSTVGVAHKRLRCGTKIALAYRGKTVVVPVIDRGPYARGIEFDLTYATAKRLGMMQTARVRAATIRQ